MQLLNDIIIGVVKTRDKKLYKRDDHFFENFNLCPLFTSNERHMK